MTAALIRPAIDADAAALGVLGRQTFLDTFVDGFRIPYPADDLAAFLDASFSPEAIRKVAAALLEPCSCACPLPQEARYLLMQGSWGRNDGAR